MLQPVGLSRGVVVEEGNDVAGRFGDTSIARVGQAGCPAARQHERCRKRPLDAFEQGRVVIDDEEDLQRRVRLVVQGRDRSGELGPALFGVRADDDRHRRAVVRGGGSTRGECRTRRGIKYQEDSQADKSLVRMWCRGRCLGEDAKGDCRPVSRSSVRIDLSLGRQPETV